MVTAAQGTGQPVATKTSPANWEIVRLIDFAEIATGNTPPTSEPKNYGGRFLFVSPADLRGQKDIKTTSKRLSERGFAMARQFPPGSVLFVCIGSTIGKCGIATTWLSSNQQINAVLPSPKASTSYLYYQLALLSPGIRERASEQAVPLINKSQFGQTLVPLPPLPEQRAIADALGDVDALIDSLDRLIAKKRDLKQGAMQQLLTGKTRLPGFVNKPGYRETDVGQLPSDWDIAEVSDHCNIATGGSNTQDRTSDGRYPFFVRSQTVERINSYSYDGEAVLTAGDGVGTGRVFHYINGRFDVHQRVYRMAGFSNSLDGYFFFLYFSTHFYDRIMSMTAKSSVDSIRMNMIAQMKIPLPAPEEQKAIAQVLRDMATELKLLERRRDKTRLLKQGMMQELLTGKTRLV